MTATRSAAPDGMTIGRGALRQLREGLLRHAPDHAVNILQQAGFAAGEGIYRAFQTWLPGQAGVTRPEELDAAQLNDVLSAFFHAAGWGAVPRRGAGGGRGAPPPPPAWRPPPPRPASAARARPPPRGHP